jgi:hypothetical protein
VQTSGQASNPIRIGVALAITGARHQQPAPHDTQSAWYFDASGAYQDTDFIDAPAWLPRGSVVAADQLGPRLFMVGSVPREGVSS